MTDFKRAAPVLLAADYSAAKAFYADKLGFTVIEEGGDPAGFGIFVRGEATVFVDAWKGPRAPKPDRWTAYFNVSDVDALAVEFEAKGVALSSPATTLAYGMREFELEISTATCSASVKTCRLNVVAGPARARASRG